MLQPSAAAGRHGPRRVLFGSPRRVPGVRGDVQLDGRQPGREGGLRAAHCPAPWGCSGELSAEAPAALPGRCRQAAARGSGRADVWAGACADLRPLGVPSGRGLHGGP